MQLAIEVFLAGFECIISFLTLFYFYWIIRLSLSHTVKVSQCRSHNLLGVYLGKGYTCWALDVNSHYSQTFPSSAFFTVAPTNTRTCLVWFCFEGFKQQTICVYWIPQRIWSRLFSNIFLSMQMSNLWYCNNSFESWVSTITLIIQICLKLCKDVIHIHLKSHP